MAKILLNVELNDKGVASNLKTLESGIKNIANSLGNVKVNKDLTAQLNALTKNYNALAKAAQTAQNVNNKQAIEEQKLAKATAQAATAKINKQKATVQLETATIRLTKAQEKENQAVKSGIPNVNNLRKGYANLLNSIKSIKKYYNKGVFSEISEKAKEYQKQLQTLNPEQEDYKKEVIRLSENLDDLSTEFAETRQEATNFHGSLSDIVSGFLKFQIAAMVVMQPLQKIREAWASTNETLVETEDAVIALKRVLNDSSLSDNTISGKLYKLAQDYGQTFENVNDIAQNFARTGMSWDETIQATESALLALNVAELDATQASDGMIAIMQQFGKEASDLTGIIDSLNKVADNYAVTTDKLLTALQRTGSSAANANLSLEETVGLITALSESTGRSGENLGTAINSLIQYSSKSEALDTFAKLDENTASVVEKYRKGGATILEVWNAVSEVINNMDSRQESILSGLASSEDITNLNQELQDELGDIFEQVSDVYGTANTFRKNYFIALLGNMKTVQEATETAQNAAGYSQKENEQYLDTYTAKLNTLKAQWKELANDEQGILGVKKNLIDMGSGLLTILKYTGGLKTVAVATGSAIIALIPAIRLGLSAISTKITEITGKVVALNASAGIIGIIATAASALIGGIDSIISARKEKKAEKEQEIAEANAKQVETSLSSVESYKKLAEESANYEKQLQELRAILDDSTSTEEEKSSAQEELLSIQNLLVESNNDYADSLDLVNGKVEEQLGLVEKLSDAQLKEQAQKFLTENSAGIQTAKNQISDTTAHSSDSFLEATGAWNREDFRDVLNSVIENTGANASVIEDNTYGFIHNYGKKVAKTFEEQGVWNGLLGIFTNAVAVEAKDWVGEAKAGLSFSGTVEEQIKSITAVKDYVNTEYETLGITLEEANTISNELNTLLTELNSEEYKNANELVDTAQLYQDFLDGAITKAEFLKKVYGIEIIDTTKSWEEQSNEVLNNYEDILDVINEMRDAEQDIVDLEEKKLELEKAQQALEDAKNNRNVRVYNASTGEWELQADQDAIADAEEKLKKAEKDYEDAVWDNLQSEIEENNLTVGEIYDKVKEISEDFPNLAKTIRDAFVAQGVKMPEYDSGGVLRGLGGIKATNENEIVLPPDITKKILTPSSNEQFSQFVKDLGLLFGSSRRVMDMKSGMVLNNGGNTSSDNRSYVANGVPFSKDVAETHTLAELFEMAAMYNK